MAQHIDTVNHNSYYDGVTLTNCTYCNVGENTTGTLTNCNYCEIGENNDITATNSSYVTVGDNNRDLVIYRGRYIVVGNDNKSVSLGIQDPQTGITTTGLVSATVTSRTVGVGATGSNAFIHKTSYAVVDGSFNTVKESSSVYLKDSTGNRVAKSNGVELDGTNNNRIEATNLVLDSKPPFMKYSRVDSVLKAEPTVRRVSRQSDTEGNILDTQFNELVNVSPDGGKGAKTAYVKINGVWTLVEL
jgi:hypothetical protein